MQSWRPKVATQPPSSGGSQHDAAQLQVGVQTAQDKGAGRAPCGVWPLSVGDVLVGSNGWCALSLPPSASPVRLSHHYTVHCAGVLESCRPGCVCLPLHLPTCHSTPTPTRTLSSLLLHASSPDCGRPWPSCLITLRILFRLARILILSALRLRISWFLRPCSSARPFGKQWQQQQEQP